MFGQSNCICRWECAKHGGLWQMEVKISSRSCPVTGMITVEAPYTHSYFLSFLWIYLFHIFPKATCACLCKRASTHGIHAYKGLMRLEEGVGSSTCPMRILENQTPVLCKSSEHSYLLSQLFRPHQCFLHCFSLFMG